MLILGLVGRKGSGKGTAAKIVAERYGATVYRFSTTLRDILERLGLPQSRENLVHLSMILRQGFGENVLERAITKDLQTSTSKIIVLDGIRRPEELSAFEALKNFHLISVEAPFDVRYRRSANRGENSGEYGMTEEDFRRTENAPTEITIAEVEKRAWKHIDNSGTHEELVEKIDEIMKYFGY